MVGGACLEGQSLGLQAEGGDGRCCVEEGVGRSVEREGGGEKGEMFSVSLSVSLQERSSVASSERGGRVSGEATPFQQDSKANKSLACRSL